MVDTVLGPLDASKLGMTLSHEHALVSSAAVAHTYPETLDRADTIKRAVAAFKDAYKEGVRTIFDQTTMDLGRDVRLLQEVSRKSGVNIVCATGIWLDIPRIFWTVDPDLIAPLFVREVKVGIEDTGIKAGFIKAATDKGGVTPQETIILRAVARAHKATGAPITTHTWAPERIGDQQVRILKEEGVDLNRVYIGHSNDSTDMDYLLGLLKQGVYLGMDRTPAGNMPGTPNWEGRARTVKQLIDAGYKHRILLSHDSPVTSAIATPQSRAEREKRNPDGITFIMRKMLPKLRELGVPQKAIDEMMLENPRRFLTGGP
jgi:phosphotriesterase-related protein